LNRKNKMIFASMLIITVASVAYAAILVNRPVGNVVKIRGVYDFNVFIDWGITPWTYQDWGTLNRGESKVGFQEYLKVIGGDPLYIRWYADEAPKGLTLTCLRCGPAEEPPTTPWGRNTWIGPFTNPGVGSINQKVLFTLTVGSSAPAGDLSFTIVFEGSDTGMD